VVSARPGLLASLGLLGLYIAATKWRGEWTRSRLAVAAGCGAVAIAANPFVVPPSVPVLLYIPIAAAALASHSLVEAFFMRGRLARIAGIAAVVALLELVRGASVYRVP
jgi:hypothetical protein